MLRIYCVLLAIPPRHSAALIHILRVQWKWDIVNSARIPMFHPFYTEMVVFYIYMSSICTHTWA